jgi:proline iminopeptidase
LFRTLTRFHSVLLCLAIGGTGRLSGQLAHPHTEWYLPTPDGCTLFVQAFGQGRETVVILHGGWGAEHTYLFDALRPLDQHYRLVFYDQRGSLLSPCSPDKISLKAHVQDLELLRDSLHISKLNIVAHSMGTFLAMTYLDQHRDRVKGLVMLGAMLPKTPDSQAATQLLSAQQKASDDFIKRPEIDRMLHRQGLDRDDKFLDPQQRSAAWHLRFAAASIFHLNRADRVKGGKAYFNNAAGQAAAKTMPEKWDFTPALRARRCTTWVIDGDHDYADPAGRNFRLATAGIAGVHLVVLPDAGHSSWIDAPERFSRSLQRAVQSTTRCE